MQYKCNSVNRIVSSHSIPQVYWNLSPQNFQMFKSSHVIPLFLFQPMKYISTAPRHCLSLDFKKIHRILNLHFHLIFSSFCPFSWYQLFSFVPTYLVSVQATKSTFHPSLCLLWIRYIIHSHWIYSVLFNHLLQRLSYILHMNTHIKVHTCKLHNRSIVLLYNAISKQVSIYGKVSGKTVHTDPSAIAVTSLHWNLSSLVFHVTVTLSP